MINFGSKITSLSRFDSIKNIKKNCFKIFKFKPYLLKIILTCGKFFEMFYSLRFDCAGSLCKFKFLVLLNLHDQCESMSKKLSFLTCAFRRFI